MQLSTQVRGQGKTGLDFEEAYNVSNKNASRALNLILMQDAKANEVDSGTELEEDEIEEIGGVEEIGFQKTFLQRRWSSGLRRVVPLF